MKIQAESDTYTVSLTLKNWEPQNVDLLSVG